MALVIGAPKEAAGLEERVATMPRSIKSSSTWLFARRGKRRRRALQTSALTPSVPPVPR